MKKCMGLILILLLCLVTPAEAQKKKLAQTGFQFLKIGLSARAEAMGGAYSMVGDGADAMFYNPAGMARMDSKIQMVAHRVQWIADINYTALGTAYKASHGIFAVNFGAIDYGELIGTQVAGNEKGFTETGNIDVGAYFVGLAYSKQLTNKFFIGSQIKYVSEHLGSSIISPAGTSSLAVDNKANAVNFTFGTIYYTGLRSLRLGIYIRNFSPEIEYQKIGFQLPLTFHIAPQWNSLTPPHILYRWHSTPSTRAISASGFTWRRILVSGNAGTPGWLQVQSRYGKPDRGSWHKATYRREAGSDRLFLYQERVFRQCEPVFSGNCILNQTFQWPYTLSPYDSGLVIEDVWPTIFFGAERLKEIRRKTDVLQWAADSSHRCEKKPRLYSKNHRSYPKNG